MSHVKDSFYFSHDSNARSDPKILALRSVYGMEGYGRFWVLVEMMREQPDHKLRLNGNYTSKAIAMELQCDEDTAIKFVHDCIEKFELFETDGEYFWSNSLLRRMELRMEKSEKARQSAAARWNNAKKCERNTNAMRTHSERYARKGKERKEKESTKDIRRNSSSPDPETPPPNKINQEKNQNNGKSVLFSQDSKPFEAAAYLRFKILENNPRARVPVCTSQDSLMQRWALEMDRLHRIGPPGQDPQGDYGYSWDEIQELIDFSQHDGFWRSNILSPNKLREQIVTLENQMRRTAYPRGDPTKFIFGDMESQNTPERGVVCAKSRGDPENNRFAGIARDAGTGEIAR